MMNMMKKMISLLVALMMLMMSAFALAEEAAPAVENNIISRALELLSKGYAYRAEATIKVGEGIDALVSENDKEMTKIVKELLDGLKVRCNAQAIEDNYQLSMAFLFGEEKLADLVISRNGDVLMLASNFLGEDVLGFTKEELKKLLTVNVTVEGAEMPANLTDQIVDLIFLDSSSFEMSKEMEDQLAKNVEELTNKLLSEIEPNATVCDSETLLLDGSETGFGVSLKVSPETMAEIGNMIVKTFAPLFGVEVPETDAKPEAKFMRSDLEIRTFPTDEKTTLVIETAFAPEGEVPVNMHGEYVIANEGGYVDSLNVLKDNNIEIEIGEKIHIMDDSAVGFSMNVAKTTNGQKQMVTDMDGHFATSEMGNYVGLYGVLNMNMADTVKMKEIVSGLGKYADDEVTYQQDMELYLEPENTVPAFIAHEDITIGLAEAYLNPETAVMYGQLDEKGVADLGNKLTQNATNELIRIITILPEDIQMMLFGSGF